MWWFSGRSAHVAVHPNLKPIMTRSCCIEWCCVSECRRRGRGLARSGRDPIWHIWVESVRLPSRLLVDPRAKRFRQSNPMGRVCRLPMALRPAGGKKKILNFIIKFGCRGEGRMNWCWVLESWWEISQNLDRSNKSIHFQSQSSQLI